MNFMLQTSKFKRSLLLAWCFLILAILSEVLGTAFLKLDKAWGILGALSAMSVFIGISYVFMGLAIKKIQIGIAYAIWELLGTLCILAMSFFIFDESLSSTQIIGIVLAFIGIICINFGEVKENLESQNLAQKPEKKALDDIS